MKTYRASKLTIKHVDSKTEREFLNANHKQGAILSSVAIGLFDGDELIQIETFGQPRIEIQSKNIQHQWELLRECSKKGCQVHGGKSRILKHFIEEYHPVNILSYCSLTEGFDGHSYAACGFTKLSESGSYHYEYQGQKILRYRMQKNSNLRAQGKQEAIECTLKSFGKEYDPNLTELENATKAGFVRVNDLGNQVWEMKFAKNIGYVYEFELEGKKYRGKHILTSSRPYYGSGTAWRAYCASIPGYQRKISIKILEWLADDDIETLDNKLTEVETKYIQEILGREDYLNISDNHHCPNYVNCHNPISNANRARTVANRSPEQKDEIIRKYQEAVANRSPEKKVEISRRMSEVHKNRTPEEKAEIKRKRQETVASRTPEQREEISRHYSEGQLNMDPNAKLEKIRKRQETIASRTTEQKAERLRKYQETMNSKTLEEKAEISRKLSEANKRRTPEQRAEQIRKRQETIANKTPEQKAEIIRKYQETMANRSPEEKIERLKKYRETMNSKTPEEKAEIKRKRQETIANKTSEQKTETKRKLQETKKANYEKCQKEKLDFLTSYFDRVENIDQQKVECFKGDRSISILVHGRSLETIKKYINLKGF
jgi:hypothetical protein